MKTIKFTINRKFKSIFRTSLFLLLATLSFSSFAQKQKIEYNKDTEEILVNGKTYAKMVKTNANLVGLNKNFSIQNLEGEEVIFMKMKQYEKFNRQTRKNETKIYYDITFIEGGGQVRREGSLGERGAMKIVVKNNLMKDGELDLEAVKRYVSINR